MGNNRSIIVTGQMNQLNSQGEVDWAFADEMVPWAARDFDEGDRRRLDHC
eukprot:m.110305 g.110305  ORF g.110305 m.110305 type:complete len:50 (+) comp15266_c0_seq2:95-244(+)